MNSGLCKRVDFDKGWLRNALIEMKCDYMIHKKYWEWAVVFKILMDNYCIKDGSKGLGFGVGTEPLPALFAKYGCDVLATDAPPENEVSRLWDEGDQYMSSKEVLNDKGICEEELFLTNVDCRYVDMNAIPEDLHDTFDFTWSAGSFEHIGGLDKSIEFFRNQMKCLKPGGIGVHVTEYNISSDDETINAPNMVFFRNKDIQRMAECIERDGHYMEPVNFNRGDEPDDFEESKPPFKLGFNTPAITINLFGHLTTSIVLVVKRGK